VLTGFVGARGLTVVFAVNVVLLAGIGIAVATGMRSAAVAVAEPVSLEADT
jgi:hypothetical protein